MMPITAVTAPRATAFSSQLPIGCKARNDQAARRTQYPNLWHSFISCNQFLFPSHPEPLQFRLVCLTKEPVGEAVDYGICNY